MAADILLKEIVVEGTQDQDMTALSGKTMGEGSVGTLVYPLEMDQETFYPEAIKFTVYQRTSANWKNVKKAMSQAVQTLEDAWAKDVTKKEGPASNDKLSGSAKAKKEFLKAIKDGSLADKGLRWIGEKAQYLQEGTMAGPAFDALTGILKSTVSGLNQKNIEEAHQLGSIYLNMPNEISFAEEASWEGIDLGMLGALAKNQGQAAPAGTLANFGSMVGGGTGALVGMLHKSIGPTAGAVLGTLGGTTAQKGIEASFGNIANPYKEMTFSGIGFRQFSFNFVFRARNDSEVSMIRRIIERFRFYSKPTYNDSKGSAVLNYPQEFRIEFLTKDEMTSSNTSIDRFITNKHIPQIKMCVCKNITTNYASQNTWRSLKDGHPVEISLGLNFEETELITGEDVIGDTKVGRFAGHGGRF